MLGSSIGMYSRGGALWRTQGEELYGGHHTTPELSTYRVYQYSFMFCSFPPIVGEIKEQLFFLFEV